MLHDTSQGREIGYTWVITEPREVLHSELNGQTWVLDNGTWYNCHPKPTWDCPIKKKFPQGGYGVRWKVGAELNDPELGRGPR